MSREFIVVSVDKEEGITVLESTDHPEKGVPCRLVWDYGHDFFADHHGDHYRVSWEKI